MQILWSFYLRQYQPYKFKVSISVYLYFFHTMAVKAIYYYLIWMKVCILVTIKYFSFILLLLCSLIILFFCNKRCSNNQTCVLKKLQNINFSLYVVTQSVWCYNMDSDGFVQHMDIKMLKTKDYIKYYASLHQCYAMLNGKQSPTLETEVAYSSRT